MYLISGMISRDCAHCRKPMVARDRMQRFCSGDCRVAWWKSEKSVTFASRPCTQCRMNYTPTSSLQRFCCNDCRHKYKYHRLKKVRTEARARARKYR